MGGNGSFLLHSTDNEAGREYVTVYSLDENIKIIERKNNKISLKPPQESHSPNRVYAMFYKDGHDVKEVAVYGSDGLRLYTIHTQEHKGLGEHYHVWKEGKPIEGEVYALTYEMQLLLEKIRKLK